MKPEGAWKLTVNTQYQDGVKIVINLVTASLVLPIVFLKNIIVVPSDGMKGRLHDDPFAYASWFFLLVSLSACLTFYFNSMKYAKALLKDQESQSLGIRNENWRDAAGVVAAVSFLLGLISLLVFFWIELQAAP